MKNFNGKPDIVGCLLVKIGLWPADFSIMYTCYKYKMFKITPSVQSPFWTSKLRFPVNFFRSAVGYKKASHQALLHAERSAQWVGPIGKNPFESFWGKKKTKPYIVWDNNVRLDPSSNGATFLPAKD